MIEIFNRLQQIFGRPITLVHIDDCILEVVFDWWMQESFTIIPTLEVYMPFGEQDSRTKWLEGLLKGARRNDAGELVQK